jgi:hypothetical protein
MTVGADDGCSCVCPLVCRMVDIIIHLIRVYVFLGSYVVFSTSVCVCVCVCVCCVSSFNCHRGPSRRNREWLLFLTILVLIIIPAMFVNVV